MFDKPSPKSIINLFCIVIGMILGHFLMSQWESQYLTESIWSCQDVSLF